jgi:hypothetical protein
MAGVTRDEILKALTRLKPGLFACSDPSKAQVKTQVLNGLEFGKNQPPWVFLSSRLRSSVVNFEKVLYLYI